MHPKENHTFLKTLSPAQRIGTVQEMADAKDVHLARGHIPKGQYFSYALIPLYKHICELTGINILAVGEKQVPGGSTAAACC